MKKIVLITTTQPAANPRVVKEADTFAAQGYDVTVLYCFVADWAQVNDKFILKNALWKFKQIGGRSKSTSSYFFTAMKFSFYKFINKKFAGNLFAEQAHARCYSLLLREAIKLNADWYIGHNPGAMAVAANASTHTHGKAGFDFEDYHRGEFLDPNSIEVIRQIFLEKKYIHHFTYLTASTPLIKEKIEIDFPSLKNNIVSILNCFSVNEQPSFCNDINKGLSLFWFSQHVGNDRGIEIVIDVIKDLNNKNITLSIVGNCTNEVLNSFKKRAGSAFDNIKFLGVISSSQIPNVASKYDVGLALELNIPTNRDICLTNKIFTYLNSGIAIIFSETTMQQLFNKEYNCGKSFPLHDKEKLKECILYYMNKDNLVDQKNYNYCLAKKKLNWENESKKLLSIISN